MKLKTFANIDLSTPEAQKKVMNYLEKLQCDFNICENTPDRIIKVAHSMLSALRCLTYKFVWLYERYYDREDKTERIKQYSNVRESRLNFCNEEFDTFSKIMQFGGGADEFIPEIRKLARVLRDEISFYRDFRVKVVDYTVLLVI